MLKTFTRILFILLVITVPVKLVAQNGNRVQLIQHRLDSLSATAPGLNQNVQLSISGATIQDYLLALGRSNNLSISVDSKLNFIVNDTFTGVSASNILVFLAKKYNLDLSVVGSIILLTAYINPAQFARPPVKEINATYNPTDNSLSYELTNDSLIAVVHKITRISGKNVIVPSSMSGKTVSGFVVSAPFETALDKLAFGNGIKMVRTSDNYYLFQPLDENEELYLNGEKSTSVRRTFKSNPAGTGGNGSAGVSVRIVKGERLISADATNMPIINLLKQASQEMNINYSIYSDIKGTIDIHVNDIPYDSFLTLLFKSTTYTFQSDSGIYLIGDRKVEGLRTFKAIHLQNRSIDTIVMMIPSDWKKEVEIKEFREQNTLVVSGSSSQINEIENFVKQLDKLVPVILIEVTMIDFHKTRTIATGITLGVGDSTKKTGGTILPGLNFTASSSGVNSFLNSLGKLTSLNLGHVVPNFYATIQAMESNNNIDVRSVPKLTALNGHSAVLSIGNKQYYKNSVQALYPSAATSANIVTNQYIPVEADLIVEIKPIVSGDDQVTLGIKVNISDFTSIPADGSPPPQSISKFESSLRVHSEDTILLGGIERTEKDLTSSGTPILSRIPILKWIFSSRTKTDSKVVTVLFIKSTIIR